MESKQITLLAVTGMSPQVVTETLWGLYQRDHIWPTDIQIITTRQGKQKVMESLVQGAQLEKLCRELDQPLLQLSEANISVVPNAAGEDVDDARSEDDHEALANFITQTVRKLTTDEQRIVHASIAGGRKTMTFYLGYAMSLFGRHHDQLSHVLVSEDFENRKDFFFPTQQDQWLAKREPKDEKEKLVNAADAEVILADIPFVRLRHNLPKLIADGLGDKISYRHLTKLINLGDNPVNLCIELLSSEKSVVIKQADEELERIVFPDYVLWSFYLLFAEQTLDKEFLTCRPEKSDHLSQETLCHDLLMKLYTCFIVPDPSKQAALRKFKSGKELAIKLLEEDQWLSLIGSNTIPEKSIKPYAADGKVSRDTFSNYITRIKEIFEKYLPSNLASLLIPAQLPEDIFETLPQYERHLEKNQGKKGGRPYYIPVSSFKILP